MPIAQNSSPASALTTQVIVMVKAPVAGKVKTRLIPVLGEEGAALLAKQLLEHTLAQVLKSDSVAALCMEPEPFHADWLDVDPDLIKKFEQAPQAGYDLGDRLKSAYRLSAERFGSTVFVGMDCPELNGDLINEAIEKLSKVDLVITPSTDGGYVLIGMRGHYPELFDQISWSTDQVMKQTLAQARDLGLKVHLFAALTDIDEPSDLVHLPKDLR